MNTAQEAAVRRFPAAAEQIAQLMMRSESFRNVCEDLAAAEHALAKVDTLPAAIREARRAEAEGWIRELTDEIRSMLYSAKVLPISQGRRGSESRDHKKPDDPDKGRT
jgi:hypothetical protein